MPNAAQVNINITNLTQNIATPLQGVSFVLGQSIRGAFNEPNEVINSWPSFVSKYGGLTNKTIAPLLCKRLLEKGGSIRFCRIGKYTDITDPESLEATMATQPLVSIITFDGPFVAGNSIDMTIDGVDIDTVNFTIDSDNTLDLLAEEIAKSPSVLQAQAMDTGTQVGNNRQIFITPANNSVLAITAVTVTGGTTQTTETITTSDKLVDNNGNEMFSLVPKYPGEDYNNFVIMIGPASNGAQQYFNLNIIHTQDPTLNETYPNLVIGKNTTPEESTYLDKVVGESKHFNVVYSDLSGIQLPTRPVDFSFRYTGGSDGGTPGDTDYIGDSSAMTGMYAFDEYGDAMQIAVLDNTSDAVNVAGSAYAANRKDLIYVMHLDNSIKTKEGMISKRKNLLIDTQYTYIAAGGVKITDPITSQVRDISGIADILALINNSDRNYGEWYSFGGSIRGLINGTLGVVNNFGSPAKFRDLNDLANHQINMVINRDNSVKLWGNFSAQLKDDQESQMSIVRLLIFLKKSLRPTLETFLEEPNDIPVWKRIFFTVKPFLDSMVTKRALYNYDWQGDQFAKNMQSLQINDPTDVQNGKYKANLAIKAIPAINDITLEIILTPAAVDFEILSEIN